MILQQDDGRITCHKIILPVWTVTRVAGYINIYKSPDADSVLHIHTYDMHGRLKSLKASSVETRLQLACLYAATGSLLPEYGSKVYLCVCVCACICVCVSLALSLALSLCLSLSLSLSLSLHPCECVRECICHHDYH